VLFSLNMTEQGMAVVAGNLDLVEAVSPKSINITVARKLKQLLA
jgi:hypothetical protein